MRLRARSEFERKYTAEANYARLLDVYEAAIASLPMQVHLRQSAAV